MSGFNCAQRWAPRGVLSNPECSLVSCLRLLPTEGDIFVTGETHNVAGAAREVVCVYDMAMGGGLLDGLRPVSTYSEHEGLVTCITPAGPQYPNLFATGSKDSTVSGQTRITPYNPV